MTRVGPKNMAEVRQDILTDIYNESAKAGVVENIKQGSDNWIWATGMSGPCMLIHARVDSATDACTPLNCPESDLETWREALGLPVVSPSQASGKIRLTITGTATIPDGQQGTVKGEPFTVVGTYTGLGNGAEVPVIVTRAGSVGNAKGGTAVTLTGQPINVSSAATVSKFEPLIGGYDSETPSRKRERILNRYGSSAGGGNWGYKRELSFNASPAVQQCFVYPAIAGPGTDKVVILREYDRELLSFSRKYPDGSLASVRAKIHSGVFTGADTVVDTGEDEPVDVSLTLSIPSSTLSGGNGSGWMDVSPWPALQSGETRIMITTVSNGGATLLIDADDPASPVSYQTRVAWWSPRDMQFYVRTAISSSGTTGARSVTFDAPFVDSTGQLPAAGDYVSPGAERLSEYASTWVSLLETLGSGENTSDSFLLENGRSLRHPFQSVELKAGLTGDVRDRFKSGNPEISECEWSYRSVTAPTVPAAVGDAPNVLVPRKFGIYPV